MQPTNIEVDDKELNITIQVFLTQCSKIRSGSPNLGIAVLLFAVWSSENYAFESLTRIWFLRTSASCRSASNSDMIVVHQTLYIRFSSQR